MRVHRTLSSMFLLVIFSLSLLGIVIPDKSFSDRENRYLEPIPKFTLKNVFLGRFMFSFEEYVSDQFPFRDSWVCLKTDIERMLGKKENNGIYFASDNYLLAKYQMDNSWLLKNVEYVEKFTQRLNLPTYLMVVPTATGIYSEKLPEGAPSDDQAQALKTVKDACEVSDIDFIDVLQELTSRKHEYIYFRTDHHWTMRGAYYAYAEWMRQKGEASVPLNEMHFETVSTEFLGTHYSKVNYRNVTADKIELIIPKKKPKVSVSYPGVANGKLSESMFHPEFLKGRDQYAYFLGGNYPLIELSTDVSNGRSILVIKDSYAHCLLPFLACHYENIYVLDPRYCWLSVNQYIEEKRVDEVLFLFNLSQFGSNCSLHTIDS